jgi:hypothetical protein
VQEEKQDDDHVMLTIKKTEIKKKGIFEGP